MKTIRIRFSRIGLVLGFLFAMLPLITNCFPTLYEDMFCSEHLNPGQLTRDCTCDLSPPLTVLVFINYVGVALLFYFVFTTLFPFFPTTSILANTFGEYLIYVILPIFVYSSIGFFVGKILDRLFPVSIGYEEGK